MVPNIAYFLLFFAASAALAADAPAGKAQQSSQTPAAAPAPAPNFNSFMKDLAKQAKGSEQVKAQNFDQVLTTYTLADSRDPIAAEAVLASFSAYRKGVENLKKRSFKTEPTKKLLNAEEWNTLYNQPTHRWLNSEPQSSLERRLKFFKIIPSTSQLKDLVKPIFQTEFGSQVSQGGGEIAFFTWAGLSNLPVITVRSMALSLIDQHYNLQALRNVHRGNADCLYALDGLAAGDALYTQFSYSLSGQSVEVTSFDLAERIKPEIDGRIDTYRKKNQIPLGVSSLLLLPQWHGLRFLEFGRKYYTTPRLFTLFTKAPNSTEKLIHPEKYFQKEALDNPTRLVLPAAVDRLMTQRKWRAVDRTVLGELLHYSLFVDHAGKDQAGRIAEGWKGDIGVFYQKDEDVGYLYFSFWDTAQDADEAFAAFRSYYAVQEALVGKILAEETTSYKIATAQGKEISLKLKGNAVLLIHGFPEQLTSKIEEAFQ